MSGYAMAQQDDKEKTKWQNLNRKDGNIFLCIFQCTHVHTLFTFVALRF